MQPLACKDGTAELLNHKNTLRVDFLFHLLTFKKKYFYNYNSQRWSEYNTNVLEYEYEYDYLEHAWVRVRVLRKQMYSSMITLEYKHDYFHDYFNEYPVSNIKATFVESLGVILVLLLCH